MPTLPSTGAWPAAGHSESCAAFMPAIIASSWVSSFCPSAP
jgi:hypothetical protein